MDLKTLVTGIAIGTAGTSGVIVPLTGEKYEENATKIVMQDSTISAHKEYVDKISGETIAISDTAIDLEKMLEGSPIAVEDVEIKEVGERKSSPEKVKINTFDGKPIVLIPGKTYRQILEIDGKIIGEAEYTPEAKDYPTEYMNVLTGCLKFDVQPDRINDTAQANEVAIAVGYEIPTTKENEITELSQ